MNFSNITIENITINNINKVVSCDSFKLEVYKTLSNRFVIVVSIVAIILLLRLILEPHLKTNSLIYIRVNRYLDFLLFFSCLFIIAYLFLF